MGALSVVKALTRQNSEAITAELDRLNAEGVKLCAEIEKLEGRQHEIEDAEVLLKEMAQLKATANKRRKLDERITETKQRLAEAQRRERAKLLDEQMAEIKSLADVFIAESQKTAEAFKKFNDGVDALRRAGFEREWNLVPKVPHINGNPIVSAEIIDRFTKHMTTAFAAAAEYAERENPQPAPKSRKVELAPAPVTIERKSAPPPNPHSGAYTVRLGQNESSPARAKRQPRRETAGEGEVLFNAHRAFEHRTKGRIAAGDVIAISFEEAEPLMRRIVGDIVTPETIANLDRLHAEITGTKEETQS